MVPYPLSKSLLPIIFSGSFFWARDFISPISVHHHRVEEVGVFLTCFVSRWLNSPSSQLPRPGIVALLYGWSTGYECNGNGVMVVYDLSPKTVGFDSSHFCYPFSVCLRQLLQWPDHHTRVGHKLGHLEHEVGLGDNATCKRRADNRVTFSFFI